MSLHIARWVQDDEGDIGITFFNILTLIKYKDAVIVYWFKNYPNADKYQGSDGSAQNSQEQK